MRTPGTRGNQCCVQANKTRLLSESCFYGMLRVMRCISTSGIAAADRCGSGCGAVPDRGVGNNAGCRQASERREGKNRIRRGGKVQQEVKCRNGNGNGKWYDRRRMVQASGSRRTSTLQMQRDLRMCGRSANAANRSQDSDPARLFVLPVRGTRRVLTLDVVGVVVVVDEGLSPPSGVEGVGGVVVVGDQLV